jgi:hypothetical protein
MSQIMQDGANFYINEVLVYTAPIKVLDWDLDAAINARRLFEEWYAGEYLCLPKYA